MRAVTQLGKVHPRRNEGILRGVLRRIVVSRHLVGCSHHRALMTENERFIGFFVAKQRHLHKELIVFVGMFVHSVPFLLSGAFTYKCRKREKGWVAGENFSPVARDLKREFFSRRVYSSKTALFSFFTKKHC